MKIELESNSCCVTTICPNGKGHIVSSNECTKCDDYEHNFTKDGKKYVECSFSSLVSIKNQISESVKTIEAGYADLFKAIEELDKFKGGEHDDFSAFILFKLTKLGKTIEEIGG